MIAIISISPHRRPPAVLVAYINLLLLTINLVSSITLLVLVLAFSSSLALAPSKRCA